ncbi:MAG: MBG domain-containing protein [Erythrobacter sp.]
MNGDSLSGALATAANATTGVGSVAITQGTLGNPNYAITFVEGSLTITPRPITLTANNLSRVYGNANPALTFAVGGAGLVNGDQVTGALATAANATTGVGSVAITQGTLGAGANYDVSFVNGQLTITPRPITVTADTLSKLFGQSDPALTFTISGDGLVNGDQLSGVLARLPGEAIGSFPIQQGTLGAGGNYTISFVNGQLTINPSQTPVDVSPAPPALTNPTLIAVVEDEHEEADAPDAEEALTTADAEAVFGMDFPTKDGAALISTNPLLDDPVATGGDSSTYTGENGNTPNRGEQ